MLTHVHQLCNNIDEFSYRGYTISSENLPNSDSCSSHNPSCEIDKLGFSDSQQWKYAHLDWRASLDFSLPRIKTFGRDPVRMQRHQGWQRSSASTSGWLSWSRQIQCDVRGNSLVGRE
jgi:hypothetical protein